MSSLLLYQGPGPLIFTKIYGNCHLGCALHEPDSSFEGKSRHKQDSHHQYTYSTYPLVGTAPDTAPLAWHSPSKHPHSPCTPLHLEMRGNSCQKGFFPLNAWDGLWQRCELLLSCSVVTPHCSRSGATTTQRDASQSAPLALGTMGHARANTVTANYKTEGFTPGNRQPMGNTTEVCNTMNSHSLIYKMQEIKSTQQKDQEASEKKKVLLLTMSFFIVELTETDIHLGQKCYWVQTTQSDEDKSTHGPSIWMQLLAYVFLSAAI